MKGKRFPAIEGFRFLACAGVLLCHFKGLFYPSLWPAWLLHTPLKVMVTGTPFVRFFLALSGFLTAYKYFSQNAMKKPVPTFFSGISVSCPWPRHPFFSCIF